MHMLKIIISRHQFKSEVFVLQTTKLFTFPDIIPPQITNIEQFQSPSPKSKHLSNLENITFKLLQGTFIWC